MKKRDNAYKFANEFMKFMANSYERRSDYTSIGYKQSMTMFLDYAEKVKKPVRASLNRTAYILPCLFLASTVP